MSELVDFLRQRLDEDEQAARAATPGPWWMDVPTAAWGEDVDARVASTTDQIAVLPSHLNGGLNALHVERHDPARVLADVEAKRQILTEHYGFPAPGGTPTRACRRCSDRRADNDPLSHGTGNDLWVRLEPAPCLTVRLLGLVYIEHPEYEERWRP